MGAGSATQQLEDGLRVVLRDLGGARHEPGHLRGLPLEVVAHPGLLAAELARAGDPEALARPGVRLVLRHSIVLTDHLLAAAHGGGRPGETGGAGLRSSLLVLLPCGSALDLVEVLRAALRTLGL